MIKRKHLLIAIFVVAMSIFLSGCSASYDDANSATATTAHAPMAEAEQYDEAAGAAQDTGAANTANEGAAQPSLTQPQDGRLIIMNAMLTIEALDFDATVAQLQAAAEQAGGYIASTSFSGSQTDEHRAASFTMRIPAESYTAFISGAQASGNLVYRHEYSEDVTEQYIDIEARLTSLQTQEVRLLEMMQASGDLAELILIQDQLADVQTEIEQYTGRQRQLDNLISYSTVNVEVYEVQQVTPPVPDSYLTRMSRAATESWQATLQAIQDLGIGLIWLLPSILILLVVALIVVAVVRTAIKRKKQKMAAHKAPPLTQNTTEDGGEQSR